jgi:hypothetical protein
MFTVMNVLLIEALYFIFKVRKFIGANVYDVSVCVSTV